GDNDPCDRGREREHRLGRGGQSVAHDGEPLAMVEVVGEIARKELGDQRGSLGDALDQADCQRRCAENGHEKQRQRAGNGPRGGGHEERDEAGRPDTAGNTLPRRLALRVGHFAPRPSAVEIEGRGQIARAGTASKAVVSRLSAVVKGTVPCHMYDGNSTSFPRVGRTKCSGPIAGTVLNGGCPNRIQPWWVSDSSALSGTST